MPIAADSMPIPTAGVERERRSRACRRADVDAQCADKAFHASSGTYVLGYKLHPIATTSGVYVDHVLRPAPQHHARVFAGLAEFPSGGVLPDDLARGLRGRHVLADRAYDGEQLRLGLARESGGALEAAYRSNDGRWEPTDPYHRRARRYIETVFSRACDEVRVKRNLAERYAGLAVRVGTKLLTRTIKQWVNYHTGKPLNRTKHWLA